MKVISPLDKKIQAILSQSTEQIKALCEKAYQDGFTDGYEEGRERGRESTFLENNNL